MKIAKRIFYVVCLLFLAGCFFILVCALNPELTDRVAAALYHKGGVQEEKTVPEGEPGAQDAGETDGSGAPGSDAGSGENRGTDPAAGTQSGGQETGVASGSLNSLPAGVSSAAVSRSGYTPPAEEAVSVPREVAGRTGYVPVQETGEQISGEEGVWQSTAGVGETGEGLDFDKEFYPFFSMLDDGMKALYRQIYANAMALNTVFVPVERVRFEQLKNVFEAVYNDHPELFWLETGYSCKYLSTGECLEITLKYNSASDDLEAAKQEFDGRARAILSGAAALGGDEEKERYVHDMLIAQADYNLGAARSQSAYSALVDGETVCAGYARAFQYLLQQLGIPCYYCTGFSGESHAWNIVKVNGEYRNVDATWDDTDPATYDYYNKTDAEFSSTHARRGLSVYLPACGAQAAGSQERPGTADLGTTGDEGRPGTAGNGTAGDESRPETAGSETTRDLNLPGTDESTASGSQGTAEHMDRPLKYEPDLSWQEEIPQEETKDESDSDRAAVLERAGMTEKDVLATLEAYYTDCYDRLSMAGTGSVEFDNVIPTSLWEQLENAYNSGSYEEGFAGKLLTELGADNFYYNVWGENIGFGYCLVHNSFITE